MKKLFIIPLLVLLFACGQASVSQEALSTVSITPPIGGYDEGTWTPSVGGTATYNVQSGRYIKIGRFVRASFNLTLNIIGTGSTFAISGLPFATSSNSGAETSCSITYIGLALASTYVVGQIPTGVSTINLYSIAVAGVSMATNAILGNGTLIYGTCDYYTQ